MVRNLLKQVHMNPGEPELCGAKSLMGKSCRFASRGFRISRELKASSLFISLFIKLCSHQVCEHQLDVCLWLFQVDSFIWQMTYVGPVDLDQRLEDGLELEGLASGPGIEGGRVEL